MSGLVKNSDNVGHSSSLVKLTHALNKIAEQPETSLGSLSTRITGLIAKEPGVALAAILIKPKDIDYLMLSGYSAVRPLKLHRPLHINLNGDWFRSSKEELFITAEETTAEEAAKTLNWSISQLEHNDRLLGIETVYVVKLKNRGHMIGLLAVGLKEEADKNHPSIEVIRSVRGIISVLIGGLITEQENHHNIKKLSDYSNKMATLDEVKDDFISMASHQLRTPLTSVKGYISMILEGDAGPINDEQKTMLAQAFSSCQRMVYIISDLLNVSRLNTGKFVMNLSPVNLDFVVKDEVDQLKEIAKARGVAINYTPSPHIEDISLDETKIRQVVMNFIDNALYYTPAGGRIDISIEDKAASITLRIKDSGMGVPRSEQRHLFTKFYRASNARKARPDGTGLGLFMAKKVVIGLGGAIVFESVEGKGSTFGFIFPKIPKQ